MANQVVVPFRRVSPRKPARPSLLGRFDPETPARRRRWVTDRLVTLRDAVRAVMETLAYMNEPRLSPPAAEPKRLTAGPASDPNAQR